MVQQARVGSTEARVSSTGTSCRGHQLCTTPRTCEYARVQMRCIQLSEEQAASIARMRELYLHNLGALMRRRQELSALLKVRG